MRKTKKIKKLILIIMGIVLILILIPAVTIIIAKDEYIKNNKKSPIETAAKYVSELKYEDAILAFEEAIKIDPRNMEAYLGLAEVYVVMNNIETAITTLERGEKVAIEVKQTEDIVLDKADRVFLRDYELLLELSRIIEAVEKIKLGWEITGSDLFAPYLERFFPTVKASLDDGIYNEEKTVELSSSGNIIYYTLDGSEPTKASDKYTEAIVLNNGENIIKAMAEGENNCFGDVYSFEYNLELPLPPTPKLTEEEDNIMKMLYKAYEDDDMEQIWDIQNQYISIIKDIYEKIKNTYDKWENTTDDNDTIYYRYDGAIFNAELDGIGLVIQYSKNNFNLRESEAIWSYFGEIKNGVANGKGVSTRLTNKVNSNSDETYTEGKEYLYLACSFEDGIGSGEAKSFSITHSKFRSDYESSELNSKRTLIGELNNGLFSGEAHQEFAESGRAAKWNIVDNMLLESETIMKDNVYYVKDTNGYIYIEFDSLDFMHGKLVTWKHIWF